MATPSPVTFHVYRFNPDEDAEPYYSAYKVTPRLGLTVLDGLFDILDSQDGSLGFRFACRAAVCGSCGMLINGALRLACQTQVAPLGSDVWISPLPRLRIIKDLVVDMDPFFENLERVKPYLITKSLPPEKERLQSQKDRRLIEEATNCILCACCHGSCPPAWLNKDYLGPAALLKAYRFVVDSRDEGKRDHLGATDGEYGVWRCHTVFNCTESCPKQIHITEAIQHLKKQNALLKLKFW